LAANQTTHVTRCGSRGGPRYLRGLVSTRSKPRAAQRRAALFRSDHHHSPHIPTDPMTHRRLSAMVYRGWGIFPTNHLCARLSKTPPCTKTSSTLSSHQQDSANLSLGTVGGGGNQRTTRIFAVIAAVQDPSRTDGPPDPASRTHLSLVGRGAGSCQGIVPGQSRSCSTYCHISTIQQ
jgi:hypothetical protein